MYTPTQLQADFYIAQCLSDDEETQKLGLVHVLFLHRMVLHLANGLHLEDMQWMKRMNECTPVRRTGTHLCLPDNPLCYAMRSSMSIIDHQRRPGANTGTCRIDHRMLLRFEVVWCPRQVLSEQS